MGKRTPQKGWNNLNDAQHLDEIVTDNRSSKRAGKAKGRRRDRRYENRLLRISVDLSDDGMEENF